MRAFSKFQICIKRSQANLDYVWGRRRFINNILSSQTTLVWLRPRNLSYEQHHSDPQIFRSFGRHNYLRHQQGLCLLNFVGSRRVRREQKNLQRLLNLPLRIGTNDHLMQTEAQLREYFFLYAPLFRYCIAHPEHRFRMKRGKDLRQIPHGKTVRSTAENRQPAWASHPPCAPSPMPQTKASGSELPPLRPHQHPREMTDKGGNLLWFGIYTGWDRLKEETKVTDTVYQPFRLQSQYCDREMGALRLLQVL